MGGDYNFPNIVWEENLPKISLNLSRQENFFVNIISKYCLFNYVNIPTRMGNNIANGGNILDLILTNDTELLSNVRTVINGNFSDHSTVICDINIEIFEPNSELKPVKYLTSVPNYNWRSGTIDQWDRYCERVNTSEWLDISEGKNVEDKVKLFSNYCFVCHI